MQSAKNEIEAYNLLFPLQKKIENYKRELNLLILYKSRSILSEMKIPDFHGNVNDIKV